MRNTARARSGAWFQSVLALAIHRDGLGLPPHAIAGVNGPGVDLNAYDGPGGAARSGVGGMITLRWVTSESAISAGIRAAEYGFWASHVEALMPDGALLGAHVEDGVQARARDYDKGSFTQELFVQLPAPQAMTDRFHAFLRAQLGKPYDTTTIIALHHAAGLAGAGFLVLLRTAGGRAGRLRLVRAHARDRIQHITPRDLLLIVSGRVAITPAKENVA